MRRATGLGVFAIAVTLTGCGGGSVMHPAEGARLFAQDCSTCHSLVGTESPRRQGGDLLGYRFRRGALIEFAREMPVRRPLGPLQLAAVVDYVLQVEQRGRARR